MKFCITKGNADKKTSQQKVCKDGTCFAAREHVCVTASLMVFNNNTGFAEVLS